MIKYEDVKTVEELKSRVKNDTLSVGKFWSKVRNFVSKDPFPGSQKIVVIYSPGYGGSAKIIRYI